MLATEFSWTVTAVSLATAYAVHWRCNLTAISVTPQTLPSNERPQPRERFLLYLVPGLAVLLVTTLFALAFFTLSKSREAAMRDGERASAFLAQIIEERTGRLLQSVDQALGSTADAWQRSPALR